MKTAREFMRHLADHMDVLTDDDVALLVESRDREIRAAALRKASRRFGSYGGPWTSEQAVALLETLAEQIERE